MLGSVGSLFGSATCGRLAVPLFRPIHRLRRSSGRKGSRVPQRFRGFCGKKTWRCSDRSASEYDSVAKVRDLSRSACPNLTPFPLSVHGEGAEKLADEYISRRGVRFREAASPPGMQTRPTS